MDTYPILNNQDDQISTSVLRDGYIMIQSRNWRQDSDLEKKLKYPKEIDPFKIKRQIIFLVLIMILLCILFGITFSFELFIPIQFFEFGICAIACLQFVLMMFYYTSSLAWCNFLSNSGFYYFPKRIISQRTLVLFVWSLGAIFLSPVLLAIKIVCDKDKLHDPEQICFYKFSNINLMRMYVGLESLLVIISLLWYFGVVVKFRLQRRWPDIWHERLLEESSLVDWCPLIKFSELRMENFDNFVTIQHNNSNIRPTDVEIMQTQAYVIGYLRKLNNNLSLRINHLSRDLRNDLITRVAVDNNVPTRQNPNDTSSLMSSDSSHINFGKRSKRYSSHLS